MPISLVERDGRVYCGGEDWGAIVYFRDPLPCCGCPLSVRSDAQICECRCHDVHRAFYNLPKVAR